MKNHFKTRETAKNLQLTEEVKKNLANLLIFATQVDNTIDIKDANVTLELINRWRKEDEFPRTIQEIKELKEKKWIESEDLADYVGMLVDILSNSDFFDIQQGLKSVLQQCADEYKDVFHNTQEKTLREIRFSNTDFGSQFYSKFNEEYAREVSQAEKYANFMYLSNQLAHAIDAKTDELTDWQRQHIVEELLKLKDWCIHKLIAEKAHGSVIDIAITQVSKKNESNLHNCVISFSIPNYLEPFIVHFNASKLSAKERKQCDGIDRYAQLRLKTTFPQYLTNKKMQLLEQLYTQRYVFETNTSSIKPKLQWLFETKRILEEMKVHKKLKNESQMSQKLKMKKSRNNTIIDIAKKNVQFLRGIEDELSIKLPEYFKNGFLKNTNYSIQEYVDEVKKYVAANMLRLGVNESFINREMAKLIIVMKMVKPLDNIVKMNKSEKTAEIKGLLQYYSDGYNFIMTNIHETGDYVQLRSKTRKFINSLYRDEEIIPETELATPDNVTGGQRTPKSKRGNGKAPQKGRKTNRNKGKMTSIESEVAIEKANAEVNDLAKEEGRLTSKIKRTPKRNPTTKGHKGISHAMQKGRKKGMRKNSNPDNPGEGER